MPLLCGLKYVQPCSHHTCTMVGRILCSPPLHRNPPWSLKPSKSLPPQRPPSAVQASGYSGAELKLQSDWPKLNSDPKPWKTTPNWKLPNPVKPVRS